MQKMKPLLSLVPPFLYSVGNLLDKNLVHRYGYLAAPVIVAMSGLFGFLILIIIGIWGNVVSVPLSSGFLMLFSGTLTSLSVFFYLKALESDSVISVAPALQVAPVAAFIFDVFFFKESFTLLQILGGTVVIIGAVALTVRVEKVDGSNTFRLRTFLLSSLSALFLATSATLFKHFAANLDYWTVQFYEYIGVCLFGLLFLFLSKNLRLHIFDLLKRYKEKRVFILMNFSTEMVMIAGDLFLNFATLLLPITFVFSVNATQPVMLLALGFFITWFVPDFQNDLRFHLVNKKNIAMILLIVAGTTAIFL